MSNRQRLYGDISLTYKLDDHFKIAGFVRKNQVTSNYENKTPAILENSATQTGVFNGYATGQTYSTEDNYELLATYFNRFGDLSLDLNAGGNIRQDRYKDITGSTAQGLSVPDLYRLDNSVQQPFNYGEFRSKKEVRSIYARGSFGFKDYLYLDWSVRRDWSSALPANKNGYTYPSVGMSFVFSEFLNTSWFSYGKLRGSFAQIGSDLAAYGLALNYAKGQNFGSDFTMATPDLLVDPNIEPSLSSSYEVGLDLRFLQNRLGLSATYYSESRKNEIIDVAVTGVSGFTGKRINAGQIDRSGIELQLNAVPVSAKDLSWDITLNFAKADNKIIELAEGIDAQEIGASFFATRTGVRVINRVGEPWGQLRGGGFKRINGQPVLTESGLYVAAPDTYFGSVLPDYTGGFFNSLQYKNFILLFNIDFQSGGKYFSLSESWGYFSGLFDETAALNENGKNVRDPVSEGGGVKVTGVDANGNPVTKFVEASDYFHQFYFQRVGEQFIHDASFIKLREVSLGYDIPVKKIGLGNAIQRLNISLVARNPLLIYAANRDFDPSEFGQYAYGEMGQFPGTRSIGFNIKVGF